MKTIVGAPGLPEPSHREAAFAAASQLMGDLVALKTELVAQNPSLAPILDALVDDYAASARMIIHEMAAEGGADDEGE